MSDRSVWIGFDDREVVSFAVARQSLLRWSNHSMPVRGVVLDDLIERGWYKRPTEKRQSQHGGEVLWDLISDAAMSTQFAISRFFVLHLASEILQHNHGWAMFVDCDVLARDYIDNAFIYAETACQDKALICVPHKHTVVEGEAKKDGQVQQGYSRKNWSSVMLLNRAHPANRKLTLELLNSVPGRDLHRFCWLEDRDIGFLDVKWNHLVGVEGSGSPNPVIVHFTNGGPWLSQYVGVEYASEWKAAYRQWLSR